MTSLLVVALVLVALLYLCLRQPRRAPARGCCAGAWPPDDLSGNARATRPGDAAGERRRPDLARELRARA